MRWALTIRQPWAWLVAAGLKDIENRSWATRHRGALLIHAGNHRPDPSLYAQIESRYGVRIDPKALQFGGIIGCVRLVDCVREHESPWFTGPVGWVLTDARALRFRPMPGRMGLFAVEE